jgi:serine/threonine protein kinase
MPAPIRRGLKAPWSAEETCLYGINTDVKIREVYAGEKEKYYVSAPLTFEPGTAKKLRIAKRRSDGGIFAVLTMHGPEHVSKSRDGKRRSKEILRSTLDLIDHEARIAAIVDRRLAPVDRLQVGTDEWHVVALMYGDAHNFMARAPAAARSSVTRKIMLDIGASLTLRLHANNILHNDLKLQNVLIDTEQGCARLSDFGSVSRLVNGRSDSCTLGTYPAPEVVLNVAYDGRADVYAWGASFGDGHLAHVARACPNPLLYIRNATGGVDLRAMATLHEEFEAWRTSDGAMGPDGCIDPRRFDPESRFGGYFDRLAQVDRAVCIYVLERMLVWCAAERATSTQCYAFFSRLAANDPQGHNRATQYLCALPRRDSHQRVIGRLDEYHRLARLWETRLP